MAVFALTRQLNENTAARNHKNVPLEIRVNPDSIRANVSIDSSEYVPLTVKCIRFARQFRAKILIKRFTEWRIHSGKFREHKPTLDCLPCVIALRIRHAPSGTIRDVRSNVARNVGICTVNFKGSFRCSKACRDTLLRVASMPPKGNVVRRYRNNVRPRYNFGYYCNVPP